MIRTVIQVLGLSLFAISIALFRSKEFKKEYAYLGIAGVTLTIL